MPQGANVTKEATDVVVAGYADIAAARNDYDAVAAVAKHGTSIEGVVLVRKDAAGTVTVEEKGDHLVEEGAIALGGVGLVLGLFAPPLLLTTALGAIIGGVAGELTRSKLTSDVEKQAEQTIPAGGAGLVVACPKSSTTDVQAAITRADRSAVGEAEGTKVHALREALADAEKKLAAEGS